MTLDPPLSRVIPPFSCFNSPSQIFNWEEWRPIKIKTENVPFNIHNKQGSKFPDHPTFEEAFKNMEKDFASDLRLYRGDCLTSYTTDAPKAKENQSNKRKLDTSN